MEAKSLSVHVARQEDAGKLAQILSLFTRSTASSAT